MNDLTSFIKDWQPKINQQLSKDIQAISGQSQHPEIEAMLSYGLLQGGKRLRPLLTLAVLQGAKQKVTPDLLKMATAVEWVHAYSLVHDDLPAMDNDQYRRGQLSLHAKFGEANAILTGDALLTGAFEVSSGVTNVSSDKCLAVTRTLAHYAGASGMVMGQYHDLQNHGQSSYQQADELIQAVYRPKTAALITYAVKAAGILLGWPKADIDLLAVWGDNFGLAFQVQDDLDDYQQDQKEEIQALPQLIGLAKTTSLRDDLNQRARQALADLQQRQPQFNADLLLAFNGQLGE